MDPEDVILWPDDVWCFAEELPEFQHKSDDYERIPFNTDRWNNIVYPEGIPCSI